MRFLHCSDVHVTADYSAIPLMKLGWRRWAALFELKYGGRAHAHAQARQTLRTLVGEFHSQKADHLILSGDVTAYALDSEFREARAALEPLVDSKIQCTVIPGNHDVYTPGAVAAHRFEKYFGHLLESDLPEYRREGAFPFVRLLGDEAAVIGLGSGRVPGVPGMSFGVIGRAQLGGLRDAIHDERVKGRAVLVVVHHAPLNQKGKPDKRMHGLVDARELMAIVPGARFGVLHGHIHRRYHHPASNSRPHLFGAGSSTQKGREGYWLIEVKDGRIIGGAMHALPQAEGKPNP